MKTAIATVTLSGSLPKKLEAAADAGFDAVELFDNDLIQFSGPPRDVKEIADDLGLKILALQPFRDLEGMPEELKRQKFYHIANKPLLARYLSCLNANLTNAINLRQRTLNLS